MLINKKYLIAIAIVALFALYYIYKNYNPLAMLRLPSLGSGSGKPVVEVKDLGMYDFPDKNAFGTTSEADRRWENQSVRKEFNVDLMPLAEGCTDCSKKGVPNPAGGDSHVCRCGPPSKRMIDAMGGHHMLPHACAPCNGPADEPSQLGRWWKRKGCADPKSVGLDMRPSCSRC